MDLATMAQLRVKSFFTELLVMYVFQWTEA